MIKAIEIYDPIVLTNCTLRDCELSDEDLTSWYEITAMFKAL